MKCLLLGLKFVSSYFIETVEIVLTAPIQVQNLSVKSSVVTIATEVSVVGDLVVTQSSFILNETGQALIQGESATVSFICLR